MQFRRQTKHEESINLTPLIDVVFLLLIFFMVTATLTDQTHLSLQLPEAEGKASTDTAEKIEVVVNAQGGFAVNGQNLVNSRLQTLMTAIEQTGGGNKDLPFVITADAKVPYESVVTAMDAAGRLGYVNINMTTTAPTEDQ